MEDVGIGKGPQRGSWKRSSEGTATGASERMRCRAHGRDWTLDIAIPW